MTLAKQLQEAQDSDGLCHGALFGVFNDRLLLGLFTSFVTFLFALVRSIDAQQIVIFFVVAGIFAVFGVRLFVLLLALLDLVDQLELGILLG